MAFTPFDLLDDQSRIWIYRANRALNADEIESVNKALISFADQWTAHNQTLKSFAKMYFDRFVVICLDEIHSNSASGCSIDSQVNFIKEIGQKLNVDFFDRLHFDFFNNGKVKSFHKDEIRTLIENGNLSNDSLVFDHLVNTKAKFMNEWQKPLDSSWHYRLI